MSGCVTLGSYNRNLLMETLMTIMIDVPIAVIVCYSGIFGLVLMWLLSPIAIVVEYICTGSSVNTYYMLDFGINSVSLLCKIMYFRVFGGMKRSRDLMSV